MRRAMLLVAFLLVACGWMGPSANAGEKNILHVFTWSSYFSPDVLADFEDAHDCHVALDLFDSNEAMLEEIQRDTGGGYDLITPSSYMTQTMHALGLLAPIDHSRIPNIRHLDKGVFTHSPDPDMAYSVPYTRTISGVGYRPAALPGGRESWEIFADARATGRVALLDDMRESLGAALKALGHSLNSRSPEEIRAAGGLVEEWLANRVRIETDEANIGLANGDLMAAHGYNGDMAVVIEAVEGIDFFVPREGSAISIDDFAILAASEKKDLAHAFVNHMLDPANAARNMVDIKYYMPVPEALEELPPDLLGDKTFAVDAETLARCEPILDVGEALATYQEVWDGILRAAGR